MKEAQGPSGILVVNRRFAQAEVVIYKPFFLVFDPRVELLEERKKTVESVASCSSSQTQSSERSLSSTVSREWDFWTTVPPADRGKAQLSHPRKGRGRLLFPANCPHLLFKKCCFSLDGTLEIKSTTVEILCPWVDSSTVLTNETSKWSNIELTLCRALLWSAEAVLLILTRTLHCMLSSSGLSPLIRG